jgi:hypothetical protein
MIKTIRQPGRGGHPTKVLPRTQPKSADFDLRHMQHAVGIPMLVMHRTIYTRIEEQKMMTQDGMLQPAQRHHEDSSILRWGGLAGIGGSVLFIVVFAIVGIFAGPEPAGLAGPISQFPEIRVARTVENGLYLAVLALWVPLALALFHSLRRTRPAAALFGSALNIFGLAGAIPHVVTSRLSDLYLADGATPRTTKRRWCSCGRRTRPCSMPCC